MPVKCWVIESDEPYEGMPVLKDLNYDRTELAQYAIDTDGVFISNAELEFLIKEKENEIKRLGTSKL